MSKKYESKMDDDAVIYKADEFLDRIKLESNSKEVDVITTGTYGRRLAKKWRRPHLEIDFKEKNKIKPYIDIISGTKFFYESKSKILRIIVKNSGRTPATYCEARLNIAIDRNKDSFQGLLHWVKNDTTDFKNIDDLFAPITIKAKDVEELDVLRLRKNVDTIETVSDKITYLKPRINYQLTVSIFTGIGNNPVKSFNVRWDGTYDGFDRCVQN